MPTHTRNMTTARCQNRWWTSDAAEHFLLFDIPAPGQPLPDSLGQDLIEGHWSLLAWVKQLTKHGDDPKTSTFLAAESSLHLYSRQEHAHRIPYMLLPVPVTFSCMSDITQIIDAVGRGDEHASEQLLPMIYQELRRLAASMMAQEPPGQTLEATALVHEAYVRLVDSEEEQKWKHRGHFFAAAAEAMRRILVEKARRKQRVKHGGEHHRVEMDDERLVCSVPAEQLIALDEALERFAQEDPEKAQLVKLRFFAGLSIEEAADALGISRATASRHWIYARAWLQDAVSTD